MDGMDAVMDTPVEGSEVVDSPESTGSEQSDTGGQQKNDDPFQPKSAREFSQALKAWRDANPENARFARVAKDAFSSQFALRQIDPKGIDGVREKYAILDSVIHNDPERGELKGAEAVAALQDSVREVAEIDALLAAGDPRVLDALGDQITGGLSKLAPAILDRVKASDPEAYAKAVLPHFVESLKSSPLLRDFNGMVDVFNEDMPKWLPEDKKQAWQDDKMQRIMGLAGRMGQWLNAQAEAVKGYKPYEAGAKPNGETQPQNNEETQFRKEQQEHHWNTNIGPKADQHAASSFQKLFAPYAKRLHLDQTTTQALKMEFSKRVAAAAAKDKPYMDQIRRYRSQRNPDPSTVLNFVKVEFDKHAPQAMKSLVEERYKPFLRGPNTNGQQQQNGQRQAVRPPVSPGTQIVAVKPPSNDIDFKRTPLDWLHQKKYMLKNGKTVQVRA